LTNPAKCTIATTSGGHNMELIDKNSIDDAIKDKAIIAFTEDDEISSEYRKILPPEIKEFRINADDIDTVIRFDIEKTPSIIIFKKSKPIVTLIGVHKKDAVNRFIEEYF